ncbi:MAG: ISAs1 family transposase [Spirulinaceae cyanobacterium RM2_2_10]|nr:ISAs1 family transposase [Spirulinaceae cyanobacterium RM2_2_10]
MFAVHDTTVPLTFDLPTDVPFAFSLTALAAHLAPLVDQRKRRGKRYPLVPLLVTAVLAKLAGYARLEDLSDWARLRAADLTALFGLARPTMPHQATWSRIFAHAIDLNDFEARLSSFFLAQRQRAEQPARGSIVLALDGKTLRGTIPAGHTQGVHLLAAFLPHEGLVLAQAVVERKENEIVVAPTVLAGLPLAGMVVVGDALHTQRVLSTTIVEANGDYVWFADQNQPTVLHDISQLFVEPDVAKGWSLPPTDFETARSCESGHGRVEERIITVSSMLQDYTPWPYLAQVFKLERRWWDATGEHGEVRYGLTSLPRQVAAPADLLRIVRAEWGIENRLHHRRDVTLEEDACQLRRGRAPQTNAALNNVVVSLVLSSGATNLAAVQRQFAFAIDRAFARAAFAAGRL